MLALMALENGQPGRKLKAAYRTGNPSKEQKRLMSWYEEKFANRSSTGFAGEDL